MTTSETVTAFVRQCSEAELVAIGQEAVLTSVELICADTEQAFDKPSKLLDECYQAVLTAKANAWKRN